MHHLEYRTKVSFEFTCSRELVMAVTAYLEKYFDCKLRFGIRQRLRGSYTLGSVE